MTDTPLLTVRALAAKLGMPTAWLIAEADAGRIPCLRAGRRRLFSLDAVQAVLLARAASERAGKGVANAR